MKQTPTEWLMEEFEKKYKVWTKSLLDTVEECTVYDEIEDSNACRPMFEFISCEGYD